jgi:osmoprotectant transport system permease protein
MYQAVREGQVDVITAFSTDGRIAAFGIRLLEDDRGVIPPYDAIVLASPRLAGEAPAVLDTVRRLDGAIDLETMQRLNLRVDAEGLAPRDVAEAFADTLDVPTSP